MGDVAKELGSAGWLGPEFGKLGSARALFGCFSSGDALSGRLAGTELDEFPVLKLAGGDGNCGNLGCEGAAPVLRELVAPGAAKEGTCSDG